MQRKAILETADAVPQKGIEPLLKQFLRCTKKLKGVEEIKTVGEETVDPGLHVKQ